MGTHQPWTTLAVVPRLGALSPGAGRITVTQVTPVPHGFAISGRCYFPARVHVCADLSGVSGSRLSDTQGLGALLLAAENAAGMHPVVPPVVQSGPHGVAAVLACHGGHVAIHALPDAGVCFADIAAVGAGQPQRGLDVVIRRLAAREVRTDARQRGAATASRQERT